MFVGQHYRAWSDCTDVQAGLAVYWRQRLISFSSSKMVVIAKLYICIVLVNIRYTYVKYSHFGSVHFKENGGICCFFIIIYYGSCKLKTLLLVDTDEPDNYWEAVA